MVAVVPTRIWDAENVRTGTAVRDIRKGTRQEETVRTGTRKEK